MYKIIACEIFKKEVGFLLHKENEGDILFIEQGLHNDPNKMREAIQNKIDEIESDEEVVNNYQGIILLYGLCGNGILGVNSKKLGLIIPKAHDCMTLFLGSKEKYKNIIDNSKGVYWYNHAWIDQVPMPCKKYIEEIKKAYYEHYDEDNAEYLLELEIDSLKKYKYGLLVKSPLEKDLRYEKFLLDACNELDWEYKEVTGDLELLKNIINGDFNLNEVVLLNPGQQIKPSLNNEIIEIA